MRNLAWALGTSALAALVVACSSTPVDPTDDTGDGGETASQPGTGGGTGVGGNKVGAGGSKAGAGGSNSGAGSPNGAGGSSNTGGSSSGSGGSKNNGGSGIVPSAGDSQVSGIPELGTGGVAKPAGTAANLTVLNWAGFKAAATFDFDDSQPSQIEHWDELKAVGVRVSFHICPPMNWATGYDAMLKDAIAQGSEVANHTMHHCNADGTNCGNGSWNGSIDQEITDVSDYIKNTLGGPRDYTLAYPWGDANWTATAKKYFFIGRGTPHQQTVATTDTSEWNLPIIIAEGGEQSSKFKGDVDKTRTDGKWVDFLFHSITPTSQNWFAGVDVGVITDTMTYAKGLGDIWVDSMVAIGSYWIGARAVNAAKPTTSGSDQTWAWTLPSIFPPGRYIRVKVDGGTLRQGATALPWNEHGYYEVALDAKSLTWSP
jgi:peptidoglycan/xylan/chitin deacetylase (PgdA/CDA1 family)